MSLSDSKWPLKIGFPPNRCILPRETLVKSLLLYEACHGILIWLLDVYICTVVITDHVIYFS